MKERWKILLLHFFRQKLSHLTLGMMTERNNARTTFPYPPLEGLVVDDLVHGSFVGSMRSSCWATDRDYCERPYASRQA